MAGPSLLRNRQVLVAFLFKWHRFLIVFDLKIKRETVTVFFIFLKPKYYL